MARPRTGSEHNDEFGDEFHDGLALNWPEARSQLHIGGWSATYTLADRLNLAQARSVLDVCCGEGGTAAWLRQQLGIRVTGLDIVGRALHTARQHCGPGECPEFVCANVFDLPFAAGSFDVVIGQDPDGFAHRHRQHAFEECRRVLLPGGRLAFHHWVLHDDSPAHMVARYEAINARLGFPSMGRLQLGDYVSDMERAGFHSVDVVDMSAEYHAHMRQMKDIADSHGRTLDAWTSLVLELFDAGLRVGALFTASG